MKIYIPFSLKEKW